MTGNNRCLMDRVLLEEYVEGLSDPLEKILVEEHIKTCPCCRNEITELKLLSWELRNLAMQKVEYPEELENLCEDLIDSVCQKPYSMRYRLKSATRVPKNVLSTITGKLSLSGQARKLGRILARKKEKSGRKRTLTGLAMNLVRGKIKKSSPGVLRKMLGGLG
jgi:predicted anti-sigma-YlaC factor YlaD